MISPLEKNRVREKAKERDMKNNTSRKTWDENVLILKSGLERIYQIDPELPYSDIDVDESGEKVGAQSFKSDKGYTIRISLNLINKYKGVLKRVFKDENDIYEKKSFKKYSKWKKELFDTLFEYGLEFLVLHEYSHIRDGHLDFLYENQESKGNTELIRTLEYHADHSAVCMFIGEGFVNNFYKREGILNEIPLYVLAAYIQINLIKSLDYSWEIEDINYYEILQDNHPLFGFRQYALLDSVISKLNMHTDGETVKQIINNTRALISDFEEVKQKNNKLDLKKIPFMIGFTKDGHAKLKEIHESWQLYKNKIERYAYRNPGFYSEWVDTPSELFIDNKL